MNVDDWISELKQHSSMRYREKMDFSKLEINEHGDFYGEVICFTGAMNIPRAELAKMASDIGCIVEKGVTKKTTLLVVGQQDVRKIHGNEKSSKHIKAE